MTEPVYGLTSESAKILKDMADRHRQRLPDQGRRTRRVWLPKRTSAETGCSACAEVVSSDSLVITVTGEVKAAAVYSIALACTGDIWTFTATDSPEWTGSTEGTSLDCGEESARTMTATMTISGSGIEPGELKIEVKTGVTVVARFENFSAWQPCTRIRMQLVSYDDTCPCVAWDAWPCLTPHEAA